MPCLYNIHTHQDGANTVDGYKVESLVNVYPLDFEEQIKKNPEFLFSCGVHPWYSSDYGSQLLKLDEVVRSRSVVAIGEAGLDKLRGGEMAIQKDVFRHHVMLSETLNKPLIVHCVKAWEELISIYKREKVMNPWILHGYRGNLQQTQQLVSLGFKFSIGEKYNEESVKIIPSQSLFCETDMSSFLILRIYKQVATTRGIPLNQLMELIEGNVKMTFCKQ